MQVESGVGHWALELHAPAPFPWHGVENGSVMGGAFWRENPDGTFAPTSGWSTRAGGFSWLDLYLMGLATPEEVPDMFILRNIQQLTSDREGPYAGEKEIITIEQIIAAIGPRTPPSEEARKVFNIGFVYFLLPGENPDPELLRAHANYRDRALDHWRHITGGRGRLTTDFSLKHTGTPPYQGTVFITPNLLGPADPTSLQSVTYIGRAERVIYDRRPGTWITVNAYLFSVSYEGTDLEFQINPEFGSRGAAQTEVDTYAAALGRLPAVFLLRAQKVQINAGHKLFGGNWHDRSFLIHTDQGKEYIRNGHLEEALIHEGAHVSLDGAHASSPGWRAAQTKDGVSISAYARDYPDREDIAESILPYFALRYRPDRLTDSDRAAILAAIPNRLIYFDEQGFDMSPYTPSEVQEPSGEIVTIQGKVIGPNGRPLEGIGLWAWAGSVDNSGNAMTGEDGAFAITVPDGSFTLDVYAPGEGCTFIGWYGPGGFTTVREDATRIEVDVESVVDIVVRLPDHPDSLPRIEWCAPDE